MNYKLLLVYLAISIFTASCALGTHSIELDDVDDAKPAKEVYYSPWLGINHKEVVEQTYSFIKDKHPSTANDFPLIKVGSYDNVTIKNIISDVSQKFAHETQSERVWELDILAYRYVPDNDALAPLFISYGIMCWRYFLIVCPVRDSLYVKLDVKVTDTKTNKTTTIHGYGGGARYISSPWADDATPEGALVYERNAKALAAAIASATNQLVNLYIDKTLTKHSTRTLRADAPRAR